MREILFRGKRIDNGEWVEGNLFIPDRADAPTEICIGTNIVRITFDVIPETVGQYTKLTDKNSERIFEGDIIQFDYVGTNRGVNGVEAVVFENGKFGVKWGWHKDLVCLDGFANTTLEVIGNIHDNPELLKGDSGNEG